MGNTARNVVRRGEDDGDGVPVIVEVSGDYNIAVGDDFVASTGANTLTFPLLANAVRSFTVVSVSGTDTLDGNGETVPNGTSLAAGVSRTFLPVTGAWLEV